MSSSHDSPHPPTAQLEATLDGDRWVLVFVRTLPHPPERVWHALTAPEAVREWAPYDVSRDLGAPGDAVLTMAGADEPTPLPSQVRVADRPHLLEYTWGDDVLRWELEPAGAGTRLTLRHRFGDREWAAKVAAGWHLCLDVAEAWLDGAPIGRTVGDDAYDKGWKPLNAAYEARFADL